MHVLSITSFIIVSTNPCINCCFNRIEDYLDFAMDVAGPTPFYPACNKLFGPSMHSLDHLEAMQNVRELEYFAEQGLRDVS